jgi:hypothetical protein
MNSVLYKEPPASSAALCRVVDSYVLSPHVIPFYKTSNNFFSFQNRKVFDHPRTWNMSLMVRKIETAIIDFSPVRVENADAHESKVLFRSLTRTVTLSCIDVLVILQAEIFHFVRIQILRPKCRIRIIS